MGSSRVLIAVLAIGAASSAALAQPQTTEKQRREAGDLVKKAIARSQAGDHGKAIELYLQAYQIAPLPILLSNVGSEYQQENKPVEALDYFCKYLEQDPTGANVSYAQAQAKSLQIQLGNQVDDTDVCKPAKPAPPAPPPTPPPGPEPGTTTTVTGTTGDLHATAQPSSEHPGKSLRLAGLGVGVAGAAAFGVGVYFGLQAKRISDDISSHDVTMPWRNDIQAYEREGQDDQTKEIVFMVAGGVAAAGGVALYLLGRSHASHAEHVAVVPTGSPTSVGLALSGGF